jgi:glutamyl-Q tRNA(Asp) synthetase
VRAPPFVTRFAPSPTGRLHRGHAFSAITAFEAAQRAGGQFLLRIEDIDTGRCRPAFEQAIYDDLTWLGLSWPAPVRRQSEHLGEYRSAVEALRDRGLLYRCFRTRSQILADIARAPHGGESAFTGAPLPRDEEEALVAQGQPYAWRLNLAKARRQLEGFKNLGFTEESVGFVPLRPDLAGDIVLARKDLGVAYHLAVVLDDAVQGVTHVIRGADLFEATHSQRILQSLLGLPTPIYRHHPLVLREDGKRFAKRDTAETLGDLRARGWTAADVRARLGFDAAIGPRKGAEGSQL